MKRLRISGTLFSAEFQWYLGNSWKRNSGVGQMSVSSVWGASPNELLQPWMHSEVPLRDSSEGKSSAKAELLALYILIPFSGKRSGLGLEHRFMDSGKWLNVLVMAPWLSKIRSLGARKYGEEMCVYRPMGIIKCEGLCVKEHPPEDIHHGRDTTTPSRR